MRGLFSALDLVFFSLSSFLLMVTISRIYGDLPLAVLGVMFSIVLVIQGLQRSIYVVPVAVLPGRIFSKLLPVILAEHLCFLLLVLVLGFGCVFIAFVIMGLHVAEGGLAFLYVLLLYLHPDFERYVFSRMQIAWFGPLFSFLSCASIGVPLLVNWYLGRNVFLLEWFFAVILLPLIVRVICFILIAGSVKFRLGFLKLTKDFKVRFRYSFFGVLSFAAYNHAPLMLLSLVSGAKEAAAFVAMRGLVQPIQILIRAFDFKDKAVFAQASNLRDVFISVFKRNLFFSVFMVVFYAIFGVFLIKFTFGVKYADQIDTMILYALVFVCMSILLPIENVINIRSVFDGHDRWRVLSVLAGLGGGAILGYWFGAAGAALACVSGWIISVVGSYLLIRKYLQP